MLSNVIKITSELRRSSAKVCRTKPQLWTSAGTPCQKTEHLSSLNTPFAASSKRGFSRSLFRTLSSDTNCILTFSLGLSVPTLRRFCRSTIWHDMTWYDILVWHLIWQLRSVRDQLWGPINSGCRARVIKRWLSASSTSSFCWFSWVSLSTSWQR